MFFKRKDKLYEDDEPLQEQLALGDMAQEEFAFGNAESNPRLSNQLHGETVWEQTTEELILEDPTQFG